MDLHFEETAKRHFAIESLNAQAHEAGWPIICDAGCRFTEKKLFGVMALWQQMAEAAGGTPLRRDMTARLLQPYIPQLSIFERVSMADGRARFRVRLMGTNVVQFTTEMSGRFLDEVIAGEFLPRWYAVGQAILHYGGPLRILHRGDSFHKKHIVGEGFAAPLKTNEGRTDLIMAVTSYEGFDSWDVIAAQARLQLGL